MFWGSKQGIQAHYSFSDTPTFTSEPWSVYTAKPKSSYASSVSAEKVSVFIFDKKQFENYLLHYGIIKSKNSSHDKLFLNDAYSVLRNQVSNLVKFKHPNILQVIEPLEEHSKNFLFVTEYVSGSLLNVFQNNNSSMGGGILDVDEREDLSIQRGILQVSQALDFIHNKALSVHLDVQPRSIFINGNSDWKLSGLGHLMKIPSGSNFGEFAIPQYDPRVPAFIQIALEYTAPELVLEGSFSYRSDLFSLGMLVYYLYNGKSLLSCNNSTNDYREEYNNFERRLASLSWEVIFQKLPLKLRQCIPRLLNRDIYARFENINEFIESDFFDDPLIKTLIFLDDLATKSVEEKIIFLNGLVILLPRFPTQLLQKKFLPVLLTNLDHLCTMKKLNSECIGVNLEVVLLIGKGFSQLSFHEKVSNHITSNPNFQVLLENATAVIIKNLDILQSKFKTESFESTILKPLYEYVCDVQTLPSLQESLLSQLYIALDTFDFTTTKNFLSPLLQKLFTKTTSLAVKISCATCFQLMIERKNMDAYMVEESLLPLITSMKTRDPRILMKFLEFFPVIYQSIGDKENVVTDMLLPLVWNFSMSTTLSTQQFDAYAKMLNQLSTEIQTRHLQKLKSFRDKEEEVEENNFTKMIDKPVATKNMDVDNEISKNIDIPVIQPKKLGTESVISPTRKSKPSGQENKSTLMLHKNVHTLKNVPARGAPRKSASPPDISDYSTAAGTGSQITNSNTLNIKKPLHLDTSGDAFSAAQTHPIQPTNTSFPPGFGMTLQPKKN